MGKVETRRLVWDGQALGFTAELTAGLHARELADSKASNPRLDVIETGLLLEIVRPAPLLLYNGAITSCFESTILLQWAQHVVSEQAASSMMPKQMCHIEMTIMV